jgi:hypothetical protein
MVELILKVIDRLIDLLERGKKAKRAIFSDHIEPLFSDLALIHADYIAAMTEISEQVQSLSLRDLKVEMEKRRQTLAPLRAKVTALTHAIHDCDFDEPIRRFAVAAIGYFDLTTAEEKILAQHQIDPRGVPASAFTLSSSLLDLLMSDFDEDSAESTPRELLSRIDQIRVGIADRWSVLTVAYAQVRLYSLVP